MSRLNTLEEIAQLAGHRKDIRQAFLIAFFVLLLFLAITLMAWRYTRTSINQRARMEFEKLTSEMTVVVKTHLEMYINVLYGVQGLFAKSEDVKRNEWATYFQTQNVRRRYPAITALRFIERVSDRNKEIFIEHVKSDASISPRDYRGFKIFAAEGQAQHVNVQPEYFVVKYVEPQIGNEEMLGFDIGSEPVLRNALEQTRDTGWLTATTHLSPITFSDKKDRQVGFSILLPIYRNGMSVSTVVERRAALIGFVDAVFETNGFFDSIFEKKSIYSNVGYEIFDGRGSSGPMVEDRLLYDSRSGKERFDSAYHPRFNTKAVLEVGGRAWDLHFYSTPFFKTDLIEEMLPHVVLLVGSILSFLTWGILYSLLSARLRALELAQNMTEELRENQTKLMNALLDLRKTHSELKITQSKLVQAEKAATVAQLAGGVAHEVKNPLASLLQGVDYLSHHMEGGDSNIPVVLNDMGEAIKRADYVIQGLLDLAKPTQLRLVSESIDSIIDRSLLLIKNSLDRSHIQVVKLLQPDLPYVKADQSKMVQVFINLFTNAMNAMPENGGTIILRTSTTKLTSVGFKTGYRKDDFFKPGAQVVVVAIEDTGMGISSDILPNIFEPFFTTRRGHGGTGLGLTIVKNIMDSHQGTIEIRNREGAQGVIVTLMLSVAKEQS